MVDHCNLFTDVLLRENIGTDAMHASFSSSRSPDWVRCPSATRSACLILDLCVHISVLNSIYFIARFVPKRLSTSFFQSEYIKAIIPDALNPKIASIRSIGKGFGPKCGTLTVYETQTIPISQRSVLVPLLSQFFVVCATFRSLYPPPPSSVIWLK